MTTGMRVFASVLAGRPPAVHYAAREVAPDVIEAGCCGALSSELPLTHSFTSVSADVTCGSWTIWRSAVAWLGGAR